MELSTHQEVAQYPTRAPHQPICPPLDPAFVLVKHKDRARLDHPTFPLDEPTGHTRDHAPTGGLEDEQGIESGLDVTPERRVKRGWGRGRGGHAEPRGMRGGAGRW